MTQQLAQSLQVATRELLYHKTAATTAAIPLPDPCQDAQHFLPWLTEEDDVDAFEQITLQEAWDIGEWSCTLTPLLSGEAADYMKVKGEILA